MMCISALHFLIILLANISLYLTYSMYQKGPDYVFVCWFSLLLVIIKHLSFDLLNLQERYCSYLSYPEFNWRPL